jgi:hypothetical protein
VNIIDEISISEDLYNKLHTAYKYHLRGENRSLVGLRRSYPTCLAVHLVAEGIYGYESGNYWGGTPIEEYGTQSDRREAGQSFERFVEKQDLETFPDRRRSHRYVSLILLHGAIPNDALPGFFEHAIQPAVHDPYWSHYAPHALVERWQDEGSVLRHLSKSVHAFLREGGEVAVDFVARCISMAERTADTEQVPDSGAVRLPERIVDVYVTWKKNNPPEPGQPRRPKSSETDRHAFTPPQLWLNAAQSQVMVDLPEQSITDDQKAVSDMQWSIRSEGRSDTEPLSVAIHAFRSADGWITEAESVGVPAPARSYRVSLTGLPDAHSWTFEGLSPQRPLLAFETDQYALVSAQKTLPARPLWLIYPEDDALRVSGGRQIEEDRSLHGPWDGYTLTCWDLTGAEALHLGDITWPIVQQGQGLRPRLTGGETLSLGTRKSRLYTSPPDLRIPVAAGQDVGQAVEQWEIQQSGGSGHSSFRPLASYAVEVREDEHSLVLPLSSLVGAIGTHQLAVRGPLGRSARFTIDVVGDTAVHLPDAPRLPTPEGAYPEKRVIVRTPAEAKIETDRDGLRLASSRNGVHTLIFDADCTHASITLRETDTQTPVSIPLIAPGIQWAVRDDDGLTAWSTRPLRRAVDAIEQSIKSELVVRLRPSSGPHALNGRLRVHREGHQVQHLSSRSRAAGQLRFDLGELQDTFQEVQHALSADLWIGDQDPVSVLQLEASLHVTDLSLQSRRMGDAWQLTVQWETDGKPVLNRCLRLWSEGRPWEEPHTFTIPDDARGETQFEIPRDDLPPGPYVAALNVEDPWRMTLPERPSLSDSNAERVNVGSSADQINAAWSQAASLERKLERAFRAETHSNANNHLRDAAEAFRPQDIPMLGRALWWINRSRPLSDVLSDRHNAAARWVHERVSEHLPQFLDGLTDPPFDQAGESDLRRFLVEMGVPQVVQPPSPHASPRDQSGRDIAWRIWPPMGWMMDARRLLEDTGSLQHAAQTIGIDELRRAADDEGATESVDSAETWVQIADHSELFGGRLQEQEIASPVPVLQTRQQMINATLRGHFDDEQSWAAVNFDWLIRHKQHPDRYSEPRSNLLSLRRQLRAGVEQAAETKRVPHRVAEALRSRYDPRPDAKLTNVPFCVGATALLQRAYAITDDMSLPFTSDADLIGCGKAAFETARRLYERDLCLLSLALAQHERSAE